jgi:hypothetical protein
VRCGAKNPDDALTCVQCGKRLTPFDRARTVSIDWFVILGNPFAVYAVLAGIIIVGYLFLAQIMGWKILGEATHYFGLVGALVASIPAAYILTERRKR